MMGYPREDRASTSAMDLDNEEMFEDEDDNIEFKILSVDEKKKAISIYRKVYNKVLKVDAKEGELEDVIEKMSENIDNQDKALEEVGINELMSHDAKCVNVATQVTYGIVKKLQTEIKFDPREFVKRFRMRVLHNSRKSGIQINNKADAYNRHPLRFEQLFGTGLASRHIHHQVPSFARPFKAPENITPPAPKRARQVKPRQTTGRTTQPTQYDASNMDNQSDESEKRLKYIYNKLKKFDARTKAEQGQNVDVPLVQLAVNPNSFATTVENFFNISFLARQEKIGINVPENEEEPTVRVFDDKKETEPNTDPEEPEEESGHRRNVQSILSFDQESYQELIKHLNIDKAAFN